MVGMGMKKIVICPYCKTRIELKGNTRNEKNNTRRV